MNTNTGNLNTGKRNTGDRNIGDWNTGDRNTGDWNTGDRNTGNWNTGELNTGYFNTGDRNIGDWNTGDRNTGNWNTGDRNTGDCNTGDWNTGNWNTGYFNTKTPNEILAFNKPVSTELWKTTTIPTFLYFATNVWISESNMTNEEKKLHPSSRTTGGYFKELDYKEAAQKAYANASEEEKEQFKNLPNFDPEVVKEIFGIDVNAESTNNCDGKTVVIEGVTYKLQKVSE